MPPQSPPPPQPSSPDAPAAASRVALPRRRRAIRVICGFALLVVVGFSAITFAQAWSMTHYAPTDSWTTRLAELSVWGKVRAVVCGPVIRRQINVKTPADVGLTYETIPLHGPGGLRLEA